MTLAIITLAVALGCSNSTDSADSTATSTTIPARPTTTETTVIIDDRPQQKLPKPLATELPDQATDRYPLTTPIARCLRAELERRPNLSDELSTDNPDTQALQSLDNAVNTCTTSARLADEFTNLATQSTPGDLTDQQRNCLHNQFLTTDPQRLDAYTAAALDPTGADPTLTTEFNAIYQECGIQP